MSASKKRRRGETEYLPLHELQDALESAITSKGSAELALLFLIEKYNFNLSEVKSRLQEKGLQVSFSKVKYSDLAPLVNLDPSLGCNDAPTFEIQLTRLPTSLFQQIVEDVQLVMKQYGLPEDHLNEEARLRFLALLFNRTVAQFGLLISNTPESTIPGRLTTRGRIEYHFKVFGALTILFVEVKLDIGTADERYNAIAQVIAESDASDYTNSELGFESFPIYGILCDGKSFDFFSFDGSTKPSTFSRGIFKHEGRTFKGLTVGSLGRSSAISFILSLRPICEAIFSFLLIGYRTGMNAYLQRSMARASDKKGSRPSTAGWVKSLCFADEAFNLAVTATSLATSGDLLSDSVAEAALGKLAESVESVPESHQRDGWNIMLEWDTEKVKRYVL